MTPAASDIPRARLSGRQDIGRQAHTAPETGHRRNDLTPRSGPNRHGRKNESVQNQRVREDRTDRRRRAAPCR
jgi:hypothetical protein